MLDNLPTTYVAMQKALAEIPDERAQEIPGIVAGWLTATKLSPPEEQEILKQAGKRFGGKPALEGMVTEARKAARVPGDLDDEDDSEVAILLALVHGQEPLLFHYEDRGYAAVEDAEGTCRRTWDIKGKAFKQWLISLYFDETHFGPSSEALSAAINTLEAEAIFHGCERTVFLRMGRHEGKIYIDLGDDAWRAIEVDADGWRVVNMPPVYFRRPKGARALPVPVSGGSLADLLPFLNIQPREDEDTLAQQDLVLIVAFLLGAYCPEGPYAILAFSGEQGCAKSMGTRIVRALIDPNISPIRSLPENERDLAILADNSYCLPFDNLSGFAPMIADALCRLSTGGGFSVRQLYEGREEELFYGVRPIILNGIADLVTRPDLADRSLFVTLQPIEEADRKRETTLIAEFEQVSGKIFGALLDGVSCGLRRFHEIHLEKLPRMADFAFWVTACETAFWPEGTFMKAYLQNRAEADEKVLEADAVGNAIMRLIAAIVEKAIEEARMKSRLQPATPWVPNPPLPEPLPKILPAPKWTGTAEDLLSILGGHVSEDTRRGKSWPQSPQGLGMRLRKVAPALRRKGIAMILDTREGGTGRRLIEIEGKMVELKP